MIKNKKDGVEFSDRRGRIYQWPFLQMKKPGVQKQYLCLSSRVVELGFKVDLSHSMPSRSGPHCDCPEPKALRFCGLLPPFENIH